MTPAIRRSLIEDELLFAVQCGKLTQRERYLTLWFLRAGDWTLNLTGISTELRAKVLEASPTLGTTARTTTTTNSIGV